MADTIEQRLRDVEYMLAHVPEDLDARFAGVDVKLAELRELILLQNSRFTKIEARLNELARKFEAHTANVDARLDAMDVKFAAVDVRFDAIDAKFAAVDARFDAIDVKFAAVDARFDAMDAKLDEILKRLPSAG